MKDFEFKVICNWMIFHWGKSRFQTLGKQKRKTISRLFSCFLAGRHGDLKHYIFFFCQNHCRRKKFHTDMYVDTCKWVLPLRDFQGIRNLWPLGQNISVIPNKSSHPERMPLHKTHKQIPYSMTMSMIDTNTRIFNGCWMNYMYYL